MHYFALFYDVIDDYVAQRALYRDQHLKHANAAYERGEIVLAGALADPVDRALIVFRGADASVAEAFAQHHPYVLNGLVTRWEVRPWTVVIGGDP